jgi:hypothetical protein
LRLDAAGHQVRDASRTQEIGMKYQIRIDGTAYPLDTEAEREAAHAAHERATKRDAEERAALIAERDQVLGRADAADKQLEEQRKRLDAATSPAALEAAVSARVDLLQRARRVLGSEYRADGKAERVVMLEVLARIDAEAKLDDASDDYVRGMFAHATKGGGQSTPLADVRRATHSANDQPDRYDASAAAERSRAHNQKLWQQPLAHSKQRETV